MELAELPEPPSEFRTPIISPPLSDPSIANNSFTNRKHLRYVRLLLFSRETGAQLACATVSPACSMARVQRVLITKLRKECRLRSNEACFWYCMDPRANARVPVVANTTVAELASAHGVANAFGMLEVKIFYAVENCFG